MTEPKNPKPSPEEIARLKRMLLKKGAEINQKLVELLNKQQVKVEDAMPGGKPGEKPVDRLRRFMALVEGRLKAIREGTYGTCDRCGDGLPYAHLEQVPWIDTCQKCAKELAAEAEGGN